jgi:hypothetical protein
MAERNVSGIAGQDVPGLPEISIIKNEDKDAEEILAQKKGKGEKNQKNDPKKEVNACHPLPPEKALRSED